MSHRSETWLCGRLLARGSVSTRLLFYTPTGEKEEGIMYTWKEIIEKEQYDWKCPFCGNVLKYEIAKMSAGHCFVCHTDGFVPLLIAVQK